MRGNVWKATITFSYISQIIIQKTECDRSKGVGGAEDGGLLPGLRIDCNCCGGLMNSVSGLLALFTAAFAASYQIQKNGYILKAKFTLTRIQEQQQQPSSHNVF